MSADTIVGDPGDAVLVRVVTIVVTTNDGRWLRTCLGSLLRSQLPHNVRLDVVLVDNGSVDGSSDLVTAEFPSVRIIRATRNLGFAGANNLGLEYALSHGADYVFLLNPDTRTPPNLVRGLVNFFQSWPQYGIVGPLQEVLSDATAEARQLNAWSREALANGEQHVFVADGVDHPSPAGPAHGRAPHTLEHAYVQGSALAIRSQVLREVGFFDVAYHTYYEETDLCRRARWAGWRVALLLDLRVEHFGGGGTSATAYRRRRMQRNKYYFLLSDPDWRPVETGRLLVRWLRRDVIGRGAIPAPSVGHAVLDATYGLAWVVARLPRIVSRRRAHAALRLQWLDAKGTRRTVSDRVRADA